MCDRLAIECLDVAVAVAVDEKVDAMVDAAVATSVQLSRKGMKRNRNKVQVETGIAVPKMAEVSVVVRIRVVDYLGRWHYLLGLYMDWSIRIVWDRSSLYMDYWSMDVCLAWSKR